MKEPSGFSVMKMNPNIQNNRAFLCLSHVRTALLFFPASDHLCGQEALLRGPAAAPGPHEMESGWSFG